MSAADPELSVIIVSYNTADLIGACLDSVLASEHINLEVFVVDNASKDTGVAVIQKHFPTVRLIANETNRGFGVANNQALAYCRGRYIVFLNPDTTIASDSLVRMMRFMDTHPEVGLAGPIVRNPNGSRQDSVSVCYPGHRYGGPELGSLPGTIACVLGACQISRTELLRDLGGFDEDFFLYGEDQDLCLRVRQRGFLIEQINDAVILHHGGQSERDSLPEEVVRKKLQAEYLFYRKHYHPLTIVRIRRRQRIRARWQFFFKRLLSLFASNPELIRRKLAGYRVTLDETTRV